MTVAFNILKEAKRSTFKLMRYVTYSVTQPFSYIAALIFLCCFSSVNLSHAVFLPSFPHSTLLM